LLLLFVKNIGFFGKYKHFLSAFDSQTRVCFEEIKTNGKFKKDQDS
jgi:hypothetical protein